MEIFIVLGIVLWIVLHGVHNVKHPKAKPMTPEQLKAEREYQRMMAAHSETRPRRRNSSSNKSTVHFEPSSAAINTLPALVYNEDLNLWLPDTGELPEYAVGVAVNKAVEFKAQLVEAHETMEFLSAQLHGVNAATAENAAMAADSDK